MTTKQVKTRKRPGAPKGNQNARKHGVFTGYMLDLKDMEGIAPEEGLKRDLKLLEGRLLNALKQYERAAKNEDSVQMFKWDKSVLEHLEKISHLRLRMIESGQAREEVWDTLEEAVRSANSRQKVRWL